MPVIEKQGESFNPELPLQEASLDSSDRNWLTEIGVLWADEAEEASWLAEVRGLEDLANISLRNAPDRMHESVTEAREAFYLKVPLLQPGKFKHGGYDTIPRPASVINCARTLAEHDLPVGLINKHPRIVGIGKETLMHKIDNLTSLGLDAKRVIQNRPAVLGNSEETIRDKLHAMTELGLDATRVINRQPSLLGHGSPAIKAKIENLKRLGLDATELINKQPSLLCMSQETAVKKLRTVRAIVRWWGWKDYKTEANCLVEAIPVIYSSDSQKIRTLARFAAEHFSETPRRDILQSHIRRTVSTPLERVLLIHLYHPDELFEPRDIRRLVKRYSKFPKQDVLDTLGNFPSDPIVKSSKVL